MTLEKFVARLERNDCITVRNIGAMVLYCGLVTNIPHYLASKSVLTETIIYGTDKANVVIY